MSRLVDELLAAREVIAFPPGNLRRGGEKVLDAVLPWVHAAHVVVADNVAEYYYADTLRDQWRYSDHFPNLAPPLPVMWIEARPPSRVSVEDPKTFALDGLSSRPGLLERAKETLREGWVTWEMVNPGVESWGVMVRSWEEGNVSIPPGVLRQLTEVQRNYGDRRKDVRWWMECVLFVKWRRQIGVMAWQLLGIGPDGKYIPVPEGWVETKAGESAYIDTRDLGFAVRDTTTHMPENRLLIEPYTQLEGGLAEAMLLMAAELIKPLLFSLCFMNCRNVQKEAVEPPRELQRKRSKKGQKPLVRYHVLKLHPDHPVTRRASQGEREALSHNALHICRGHFKHYTAERPLLGKHAGTFWWPAQVRGRSHAGIVLKDYEIEED